MSPRQWLSSYGEKIAGVVTVLLLIGCLGLLVWSVATGQDTNAVVKGQNEDRAAAQCRSSFATADAVASARLDVAKAQGIDTFLAARAGVPLDRATFTEAHLALTSAIQVREAEALMRGLTNVVCSPPEEP